MKLSFVRIRKPNTYGWYKSLDKIQSIKIHEICFDGTKTYRFGITGWHLNDFIDQILNSIWKTPFWCMWVSIWLLVNLGGGFVIIMLIDALRPRRN